MATNVFSEGPKLSQLSEQVLKNVSAEPSLSNTLIYVTSESDKKISAISKAGVILVRIGIDKESPETSEVTLDVPLKELRKKPIIMVDDVLNTGKIITYSMKPFLSTEVKKIEVAVLVKGLPQGTGELVVGRVLGLLDAIAMTVLANWYGTSRVRR